MAMNREVNAISQRLSLRAPQRQSLEILDRVCNLIKLDKSVGLASQLEAIKAEFPTVEDFERDFPSLCFALATGVGKTRLMGAFIAYLYRVEKIEHFFVLAPNLTIYDKLIADFTPNTPKYVFQGIAEFAVRPPQVVTGDNYKSGVGVRSEFGQMSLLDEAPVHINIFNISKINKAERSKMHSLNEVIGESYFEYLSNLDDLVLLMDESHRYRASAAMKALNALNPILGLELTATPQIEKSSGTVAFKNTIYSYPLSMALTDGYIKKPAVATRENFKASDYNADELEKLKLEDGVHVHEECKVQLDFYARENGVERVKPFMLVVAKSIEHAGTLMNTIESDKFFDGRYQGKVIQVHSESKAAEKDDVIQQLLSVEDPENPVEIVIHVNMLKEGWDVTNLYTIVPLRAANSKTLVEQSIGRGLRLPYGKLTGNEAVDRLTIVAHDKFQEIVDHAKSGESILVNGIKIGTDIPDKKSQVVEVSPNVLTSLTGGAEYTQVSVGGEQAGPATQQRSLFKKDSEIKVATATVRLIQSGLRKVSQSADLTKPEVQAAIAEQIHRELTPAQASLEGMEETPSLEEVRQTVERTTQKIVEMTIDIPRITVVPSGEVTTGYKDFDLDASAVNYQPIEDAIRIQELRSDIWSRLRTTISASEERLEDYLVSGLIDYDDISYDDHAAMLYKLAGQLVAHLRSYLPDDDAVLNVLLSNRPQLVRLIHTQMEQNFEQHATSYEITRSEGFTTLRATNFMAPVGEEPRDFRLPIEEKRDIRKLLFRGFEKCLFPIQKFDSTPEKLFAIVLENDRTVQKWVKPGKGVFRIGYTSESDYEPDFVAETETTRYLCEPKRASDMEDSDVIAKANAAAIWCQNASTFEGKPWVYLLIPDDAINEAQTIEGLAAKYTYDVPADLKVD